MDARLDLRALLGAVEAAPPVDAVAVLGRELAAMVGAEDVTFLIADFSGAALIRFVPDSDGLETVPLDGSPHERAIRTQRVLVEGERVYAPVTDRGDALGVLELTVPAAPGEDVVAFLAAAAHALAYVLIANRRHTDVFERGQRNLPFSLAAEIQRRLLPPAFTCEAAEFTLAGWLEPASDVGGDTFDYSVERDVLHLTMSDAMGHTVRAAQLATLAVGSLRNSRRAQVAVGEQARAANAAIVENAGEEEFVSAIVLRIDLASGELTAVNAGHPLPYLVRDGVPSRIPLDADLAFGMLADVGHREQRFQLQRGDRVLLVTDGMLERNATMLDISTALLELDGLHPREVVHAFARSVLDATGGSLQDDATVMCVDWYGRQPGNGIRIADAGASQARATDPS